MLSEEQDQGEARGAALHASPLQAKHYLDHAQSDIDTPNKSQASPLDPFLNPIEEEAKRIAAMIKAECLRGTASAEKERVKALSPGVITVGEEIRQDRNRWTPTNELSARHLAQEERLQGDSNL